MDLELRGGTALVLGAGAGRAVAVPAGSTAAIPLGRYGDPRASHGDGVAGSATRFDGGPIPSV